MYDTLLGTKSTKQQQILIKSVPEALYVTTLYLPLKDCDWNDSSHSQGDHIIHNHSRQGSLTY